MDYYPYVQRPYPMPYHHNLLDLFLEDIQQSVQVYPDISHIFLNFFPL